jgi:hypothetical protein
MKLLLGWVHSTQESLIVDKRAEVHISAKQQLTIRTMVLPTSNSEITTLSLRKSTLLPSDSDPLLTVSQTCMLISQGGGAPSGMPRASFSSCDNTPGFISRSFTCIQNPMTHNLVNSLPPSVYLHESMTWNKVFLQLELSKQTNKQKITCLMIRIANPS